MATNELDVNKLADDLGDVIFTVRTGAANAQDVAEYVVKHLAAAGYQPPAEPFSHTPPPAAYELFRAAMLDCTKPIAWHAGVEIVWALAVHHGRKLAAADVAGYGRALCAELGDSAERIAAYGGFGQAWADAEALALHGPAGAGLRLVRSVEDERLAARDDAVGRAWRAAERGVVLDDPNEDEGEITHG